MEQLVLNTVAFEDEKTLKLFKELKFIKKRGYLTKAQLLKILQWKSPRPLKHYITNSEKDVKEITRLSFSTTNEKLKIHILTALRGINYPTASAILMFYDKQKYPVLDIRVWQQLYQLNLVDTNAKGQNFTLSQWDEYLAVIRTLANHLKLNSRQVEKRIFDYDKQTRIGNLYK